MLILGIESSCDETAASVINGQGDKIVVLSNIVSSQIDIHKKYGGVVPEVAAREHVLHAIPVIEEALLQAGLTRKTAAKKLSAIAVTAGPGLITSLITGTETAKSLAFAWSLPLVSINHVEAHTYANFIGNPKIKFPALILTVSGGHTLLVLMTDHGAFKIIGETIDDAAGEAFDKAAKLMDIGYPGGPIVSKFASEFTQTPNKYPKIVLPRPLLHKPNFNFSFSGLKTALLYQLQKDKNWQKRIPEYCHEFEQAIVQTLVAKTIKAAEKYKIPTIMLAGGVSANSALRFALQEAVSKQLPKTQLILPDLKYTTDNAAMIATNGYFRFKNKQQTDYKSLKADPNLAF